MLNDMIPLPPHLSAETRQDISALWRIAYPIMIQSAATTAVNLLDALMVGALGDAALTAPLAFFAFHAQDKFFIDTANFHPPPLGNYVTNVHNVYLMNHPTCLNKNVGFLSHS